MRYQPAEHGPPPRLRADLMAITAVILLASVFPVNLVPSAVQEVPGVDGQFSGKQGDILLVTVPAHGRTTEAVGEFLGRRIPFFLNGSSGYVGLLGLDMQDPPGSHELTVQLNGADPPHKLSYNVLVLKEKFPAQHLTLPKDQVDLDDDALARARAEQEQAREVLAHVSADRFWRGGFIKPVQGRITGAFGSVRVINGQARSPHNGEDIAAPLGTDVVAMNDGVVRLTAEHFFAGHGIFLDHGLGLYSMYFHLSEIVVQEGQRVTRGEVIGKVGASGRASGPHLHWGVRVNGARVNPYSLLRLRVE